MTVSLTIDQHVARVTLARPAALNAVDLATEAELQRIWTELEQNRDVRVIVLTGEGERAFCVGADLKNPSTSGLEYWAAPRPGGFGGIALRETLNVPVIARVNGFALGGGFEMVLGCDLVVACEEASFGLPEALVGRMPLDGGMTLLQRQIPYRQAMAMLLTGPARGVRPSSMPSISATYQRTPSMQRSTSAVARRHDLPISHTSNSDSRSRCS